MRRTIDLTGDSEELFDTIEANTTINIRGNMVVIIMGEVGENCVFNTYDKSILHIIKPIKGSYSLNADGESHVHSHTIVFNQDLKIPNIQDIENILKILNDPQSGSLTSSETIRIKCFGGSKIEVTEHGKKSSYTGAMAETINGELYIDGIQVTPNDPRKIGEEEVPEIVEDERKNPDTFKFFSKVAKLAKKEVKNSNECETKFQI